MDRIPHNLAPELQDSRDTYLDHPPQALTHAEGPPDTRGEGEPSSHWLDWLYWVCRIFAIGFITVIL